MKDKINTLAIQFSREPHGSSNLGEDKIYIMGQKAGSYVPISHLAKHISEYSEVAQLQKIGYLFSSLDYLEVADFSAWYKAQFGKKLSHKQMKEIGILYYPEQKEILEALTLSDRAFQIFNEQRVLMNGKNLPVQLGEWFAKSVFGLRQIKSSSQRGFDFYTNDMKRVEVKVHWNDFSSPKGVKIKKSLLELSEFTIIMYISKSFMIRDILFLDSNFIMRKLNSKGHTLFIKDSNVSKYFFSVSSKHMERVVDKQTLMRFAHPNFAMKLLG